MMVPAEIMRANAKCGSAAPNRDGQSMRFILEMLAFLCYDGARGNDARKGDMRFRSPQ